MHMKNCILDLKQWIFNSQDVKKKESHVFDLTLGVYRRLKINFFYITLF